MPSLSLPPCLHSSLAVANRVRGSIQYITFTVSFGLLVDLAAYGLVVPVLPFRLASLHFDDIPTKSSYLIAAYAAGLIISSVPIGIFGEIVKSRKAPLLFCLLFLAASLILFWLSTSFPVLIIARILQGFSGSGIWTLGLALICDTVPEAQLGVIMGYVMIGWSIGSVVGPLAGGILYDTSGYHSIFIFALTLTGLDFVLRMLVKDKKADTSYQGPELSTQINGSLAPPSSIPHPPTTEPFGEADLLTVSDAVEGKQEKGGDHMEFQENKNTPAPQETPLPQDEPKTAQALFSLLYSPRAWTLFFIIFLLGFGFGGLMDSGMTILVNKRYGLNSRGAGLVFIGAVIPSFVSSPLGGHFSDKYGARWPVVVCLALGAPFFALMSLSGSLSRFLVWVGLTGLFIMGIAAPVMEDLSQVVKITPGLGYAHVYGIFNMIYSIGALVGPLCVGELLGRYGIETGWMVGCLTCTAMCAVVILPAWLYLGDKSNTLAASPLNSLSRSALV